MIFYLEEVSGFEDGFVEVAMKSVEWPVDQLPETFADADEDFLRSLMSVPQESIPDPAMLPSNFRRQKGGSQEPEQLGGFSEEPLA